MANFEEGATNPNLEKKLQKAREELTRIETAPDGYIEVRLSTRGKIGAPESFYVRNFSAEDLMTLGLADKAELPIKLVKILDDLIYEEGVSVKDFHEKEVIELLLFLYETFYTSIFPNQEWILTDEDWNFLKETSGGDTEEFRAKKRALENKEWKPTFDIDISKDIQFYEVPDDLKCKVKIEREFTGKHFSSVFSLPKFGDFLTLKYFIDSLYKEKDKQFARISETYKFRKDTEERLQKGENVDISKIPTVPKAELDKLRDYETEKSLFAVTASKALYLMEFDGEDVSQVPLEKRIVLAQDPRFDYSTFKMVQDHFNELQFGIKEDITVIDPILNKVVTRKYTFQLTDLLTAIRDSGTSKTTISFV